MASMGPNPYVVGQWVRGERFYGRGALIEEALAGNRNCLWVCGTRRIGKTSLLKQSDRRGFEVPNCFFRRWLRERSTPREAAVTHLPTMAQPPSFDSDRFDSRYRLVAELGRGATGVVYRAIDEAVGGPIAINVIKREYSGHPETLERIILRCLEKDPTRRFQTAGELRVALASM